MNHNMNNHKLVDYKQSLPNYSIQIKYAEANRNFYQQNLKNRKSNTKKPKSNYKQKSRT